MFEIPNTKTTYQSQEDSWGHSIVQDFYECGGFNNRACLESAHAEFSELIPPYSTFDGYWGGRCRSLALWAYICIELDLGKSEIELAVFAIVAAQESLPSGQHPDWRVQLAFDLLQFKYDENNLEWIEYALRETSQLAWPSFDKTSFVGDPNAKGLEKTIVLLRHLAVGDEISGANLILFSLVGESKNPSDVDFWLKNACRGESPVKELAAFYLGCWKESRKSRSGLATLQCLGFPSEDDPNYPILASIASNAEAVRRSITGSFSPEASSITAQSGGSKLEKASAIFHPQVIEQFDVLSRSMKRLAGLLETQLADGKSISVSTAPQLGSGEITDCTRNLSVETGRLIEATLKQGLISWFVDNRDFCRNDPKPQKDWNYDYYCNFIGQIFGHGENCLGIHELLGKAGIKVPREDFFKFFPVRGRVRKTELWDRKTNFFSLLIANLLAAKCNENHPFRLFSADDLVEFLESLNVAYGDRNLSAHFSISSALKPVDALRRAGDIQNLTTRFLCQVKP